MTIVLTICSNNYLAHAKVLGESLTLSNPDYQFVIGLVDCIPKEIDVASWLPYEVIPVASLGISEFSAMAKRYNVVELNTAVKPFYMEFIYRQNPAVKEVIYLDPDIFVFGSLKLLQDKLCKYNVVVTPHSCTFDDSATNIFYEIGMLCTGIYNLGFLATSRSETTFAFLKWWQLRLREHCYYKPGSGLFVDQIWLTLAPLYFPGIYIERNPGYNMSYWNLFERRLSQEAGRYVVNGQHDLVFYHFSSYSPNRPEVMTKQLRVITMSFAERPELKTIYDDYRSRLLAHGYNSVKSLAYAFRPKQAQWKTTLKLWVKNTLATCFRILPMQFQTLLKKLAHLTLRGFN